MSLTDRLRGSQDNLESARETKYCIQMSSVLQQQKKKQQFTNKCTFSYSLPKMNRQKIYGCLLSFTSQMYPKLTNQNQKITAWQYSSQRVQENRKNFTLYRQQPFPPHNENIKRYSQLLNKQKQKQGGIDSFWMFKKDVQSEQKKNRVKNVDNQQKIAEEELDKVGLAFLKILSFGKLNPDKQNGLISKNLFKNYITSIFGQSFSQWFIKFYQIRSYINFKQFQVLSEKFSKINIRQSHLVSFFLYDCNQDGFICPRDVFSVFQKQLDSTIQNDVLLMAQFARTNDGRFQQNFQKYKIQQVVIRDSELTHKDYETYFKKIDQPYLRATNKKDTGYSKTFAILDHRQPIRSTRRQLTQKKTMYNERYGQMAKQRKNIAYVQSLDYKLNYGFFYQIFKQQSTKLYLFFCTKIFGGNYLKI